MKGGGFAAALASRSNDPYALVQAKGINEDTKKMTRSLADTLRHALRVGRALAPLCFLAIVLALPAPPAAGQAGPPPMPGDQTQPGDGGDPPARVGRLSYIQGTVSFHTLDEDQWEQAVVNYPVTEGLSFWTEPGARATLQLGHGVVRLDGGTEVDVQQFNDQVVQINVPQGSVNFRLRRLEPDESYQVTTPSGTVALTAPGRYRVDAGANGGPGGVTVFEGSVQPAGDNFNMAINSGPQAQPQEIDSWSDQQESRIAQTPNYVSPDMPGVDDLAGQGNWDRSDYGPVWYPPVEAGWAPYRYGHWAFVPPWGWTWVDDASWGFAPFHYGRWVMIGPRWAWVPGRAVERPVYAPALVAFVGGANFAVSVGVGPVVGWVPLGPREVYVPPYRYSEAYVRRVNVTSVTNVNNITINNITVNRSTTNFVNASAATVVRTDAMTRSARISNAAVKVNPAALGTATVNNQPAVKPTLATVGAGPTVVKALGGNVTTDQRREHSPGPKVEAKPLPTALVKPLTTTGPATGTGGGTGAPGPKNLTPTAGAGTGINPNANTNTGNKGTGAPGPKDRFAPAAGAGTGTNTNTDSGNKGTGGSGPNNKFTTGPGTGATTNTNTNTNTGNKGTGGPGQSNKFTTGPGTGATTNTNTNTSTNTNTGNQGRGGPGQNNKFTTGPGTGATTNTNTDTNTGNKGTGGPGPNNKFTTGPGTGATPNTNTNTNTNVNTNTGAGAGGKGSGAPSPTGRFAPNTNTNTNVNTNTNGNTGNKGAGAQTNVNTNLGKPPPPPPPPPGGNKNANANGDQHGKPKCDPKVQKCPPP